MSKLKLFFASLILIAGVLTGCNADSANQQAESNETTASENQEESVTILITKNKGEEIVTEKEIPIEDGAILYDVMKKNFEINDNAGYITAIEGIEAKESEQMAWMFFVNDEMASVGAKELELSPGDTVNFDLQSWE